MKSPRAPENKTRVAPLTDCIVGRGRNTPLPPLIGKESIDLALARPYIISSCVQRPDALQDVSHLPRGASIAHLDRPDTASHSNRAARFAKRGCGEGQQRPSARRSLEQTMITEAARTHPCIPIFEN